MIDHLKEYNWIYVILAFTAILYIIEEYLPKS
jgi:hypothetical protein